MVDGGPVDSYGAFSGGRRNKDYPAHVRAKLRSGRKAGRKARAKNRGKRK